MDSKTPTVTVILKKDVNKERTKFLINIWTYFIVFSGSAAQRELWLPRSRGFVITHNDAPQSIGLLRTSDQLVT
jgi:hypothetical protein